MKITDTHVYFWNGPFSNWLPCAFEDHWGKWYNTEQAFMFQKAMFFGDLTTASKIARLEPNDKNPKLAKVWGREVRGFDNEAWSLVRASFMTYVNMLKYKQNPYLKQALLEHKEKIFVEASPIDKVWGVGLGEDDPLILEEKNWQGLNLLGKSLNEVVKLL
jgi:ribA/ribD-fused uncharacterized protein